MSIDLRIVRDRIRIRLRDMDAPKNTFNTVETDQAIASYYLRLRSQLPAPVVYTASGLTISAGAASFDFPSTVTGYTGNDGQAEYAGEVKIQLVSTGTYLKKLSQFEMDQYYDSAAPASFPQGKPFAFDLRESSAQLVTGRLWPAAKDAEVCNLWVTRSADDVRDFVGAGTDDMDDVQVQLSRVAADALELYVAADLLDRMSEEDLKLRRWDARSADRASQGWRREAAKSAYKEAERMHNLADNEGRVESVRP